jgi:predicted PurR-regulated permease PerM
MPGIWVFTSVIIGAGLGGIGGVLLGVPLAATIYKILREQVNKRNAANKQASETSKVCSETSQNEENQQETIG